jgi:purine-cytosine permease-like protein
MKKNIRAEMIITIAYLAGIVVFYFFSSAPLWIFIVWAILACSSFLFGHRTMHTGVNTMLLPTLIILAIFAIIAINNHEDLNFP